MTTDRKIFIFTPRRGIMAEIEYPGVAQLVGRDIWDVEVGCSSHLTRTTRLQKPMAFGGCPLPVGLSNILDREHGWRKPAKGPHGKVVGAAVMDRELLDNVQ